MSVTAASGFEAGGPRERHQAVGRARPRAWSPPPTTRRSPRPGCSPPTSSRPRRCRSAASTSHDGARPRSSSTPATPTPRPARPAGATRCRMAQLTAESARVRCRRDVLVCSTGLIGIPMPMDPVESGIPKLATMLTADADGGAAAADARCSPPTPCARRRSQHVELAHGVTATIGGMAKGAAMLVARDGHDARGAHHRRRRRRRHAAARCSTRAVADTFNALIVDDCTSTNDTVLVLANGALGNAADHALEPTRTQAFGDGLTAACADLAHQMAADAEGATKLATHRRARRTLGRRGAHRRPCRGAGSQLVQCSLYGNDPYWGRVLSELGASGARFDPERVDDRVPGRASCAATASRADTTTPRSAQLMTAARHRDRLRSARRHRRGHRDVHRPHARVRRREHGHVVSGRATAGPRARDASAKAAILAEALPYIQRVLGHDRRDQVRRPRDGRPGARRPLRAGRRAHAPRRHEPGRRARRRSADHRADAAPRARSRSSSTGCGSPTPRPSTSCAWRSSAR